MVTHQRERIASLDYENLPPRLTTAEVCALARIAPVTLWRRIKAGVLKLEPCDQGRSALFDRQAVLIALGMVKDAPAPNWTFDPDAYHQARSRKVRDAASAGGRHISRPVRGAAAAPSVRLVSDNPPAGQRR